MMNINCLLYFCVGFFFSFLYILSSDNTVIIVSVHNHGCFSLFCWQNHYTFVSALQSLVSLFMLMFDFGSFAVFMIPAT